MRGPAGDDGMPPMRSRFNAAAMLEAQTADPVSPGAHGVARRPSVLGAHIPERRTAMPIVPFRLKQERRASILEPDMSKTGEPAIFAPQPKRFTYVQGPPPVDIKSPNTPQPVKPAAKGLKKSKSIAELSQAYVITQIEAEAMPVQKKVELDESQIERYIFR